jgi:hypothetical protein
VHGHPRETGWVVAHVRPPVTAEDDQLALVDVPPPVAQSVPQSVPEDADPEPPAEPAPTRG